MPIQGTMFRPRYKRGARYAVGHKCLGCRIWLYEIPRKNRYIYLFDESFVKGWITFYRCACGTINWVHRLVETDSDRRMIELELEEGAHRVDSPPEWAEGDPSKGEMDWIAKSVDSRTKLPYGFAEKDMNIIRDGLQALWNNTQTRELVEQQLLKSLDTDALVELSQGNEAITTLILLLHARKEPLSRVDRLLAERWFYVVGSEVKVFDRKDNY